MIIGVRNGARWRLAPAGLALALTILSGAPGASATTLLESDLPGSQFSGDWRAPTVIAAGTELIGGKGGASSDDYFLFTDLPGGAQSLALDFSAPAGIGYSYSAGGVVLFDTKPFAYEWAGTRSATVQLDYRTRRQSVTLALPESFGGQLFLAFNFTHGENIAYALSVPSNALIITGPDQRITSPDTVLAAPHVVPIPASGLLMGLLFGASGLLLWSRS